jgi:hypothetical protein
MSPLKTRSLHGFALGLSLNRHSPGQMIAIYKTKITPISNTLPYRQHGYATPIEHENI